MPYEKRACLLGGAFFSWSGRQQRREALRFPALRPWLNGITLSTQYDVVDRKSYFNVTAEAMNAQVIMTMAAAKIRSFMPVSPLQSDAHQDITEITSIYIEDRGDQLSPQSGFP
jgi:hypothetical protein